MTIKGCLEASTSALKQFSVAKTVQFFGPLYCFSSSPMYIISFSWPCCTL